MYPLKHLLSPIKKTFFLFIALLPSFIYSSPSQPNTPPCTKSFIENSPGFENLLNSVVKINTWQNNYDNGVKLTNVILGSGVIISPQGHILTNAHVIDQNTETIVITLPSLETVKANKLGWDHWTDLAIIQIDPLHLKEKSLSFAHASLGDSSKLNPADFVYAVGTPHGFNKTVSLGIISNPNQYESPTELSDEYLTGVFNNWIQTDAAINPGNSGGPLATPNGEIIGINTWIIFGANNLGFAVPSNTAKEIIPQLISHGKVIRSTIGIQLSPLAELESNSNVSLNKGILISNVEPHSPAALAGLKAGDILLKINDTIIDGRFPEQIAPIMHMIAIYPINTKLHIQYKRNQKILETTVTTEALEERYSTQTCIQSWGLCLQEIKKHFLREKKLPDTTTGLRVISLQRSAPAELSGLHIDDIILKINKNPISTPKDIREIINQLDSNPDKPFLLEVLRDQSIIYLHLKP